MTLPVQKTAKTLLILDLDETLIHACETALERPEDFRCGPYFVYLRPYLAYFWNAIAPHYELAIWSTGSDDYVSLIVEQIRPLDLTLAFVWGASKCTLRWIPEEGAYVYEKRLAKLKSKGYSLERMLIVDDSPEKCRSNYGNAIYIQPFMGELEDQELNLLAEYLPTLAQHKNIRQLEKRNWRLSAKAVENPQLDTAAQSKPFQTP